MKKDNRLSPVYGLCLFFLSLILAEPARAQSFGTEEDVKQLKYLNSLYIQSYIHSDTATYNLLLWADDFIQQSANGNLDSKKECMVAFGKPRLHQINYFFADNVEVRFITNDVAMIHARTPFSIVNEGKFFIGMSQYSDIYVRRGGKWICVSANITKIESPSKIEADK